MIHQFEFGIYLEKTQANTVVKNSLIVNSVNANMKRKIKDTMVDKVCKNTSPQNNEVNDTELVHQRKTREHKRNANKKLKQFRTDAQAFSDLD